MEVRGFGEVMGYDDLRPETGRDARECIETFVVLLELEVRVREPLPADFFHQSEPFDPAFEGRAALALRAHRCNRAVAHGLRKMPNRLGPQV